MDWIRRSYTTTARPFRDSDETVTIVWYPCVPEAPALGFPTMMVSEDWDSEWTFPLPGGEVPGAPRPFRYERPKPGATGEHVCGTQQDFEEGCKYEPDEPAVVYGTLGLPNCCDPAVVTQGGVAFGGQALVSFSETPGTTCADAATFAFEVNQAFTVPGAGTYWHRLPGALAFEHVYLVSNEVVNPGLPNISGVWSGADCLHLNPAGSIASGPNWEDWFTAAAGDLFFTVTTLTALNYSVLVTRTHP